MKIDLVYLWVDGTDPQWIAKKNRYLPKERQLSVEIAGDCRFVDHDELKYSLRSVERFAPWINHIYIVTDSQRPKWLDSSSPKITIVDHSEIIPQEYLPIYNSTILEFYVYRIKGLSEHFLYANDDMLFGRSVEPSFFFHPDGEPIVRLAKQKLKGREGNYQRKVYRMLTEVNRRYKKHFTLAPHHNIDAYRRSDFERAVQEFEQQAAQSLNSRFRCDDDLHRSVIHYLLLANSHKSYVRIGRYNGATSILDRVKRGLTKRYIADSRCFPVNASNIAANFYRYNPALFTINDESSATEEQRAQAIEFLEGFLPERSSFEL